MPGTRKIALMGALLAAGLVSAGSIQAQMPGAQAAPEGLGPMRGFERLHQQLNLDPQQEERWKQAQAAQREAFRSMRARAEEMRAQLRVEIDKPGADLKQFAETRDRLRSQMQAQMEGVRAQARSAWFAVYDSLDAAQKEQVRVAIRDGMDRMARGVRGHRPERHPGQPARGPGMG
ncbi:MAG: periplasmic heavy metal sensor [Burkholderiales bacterium]